MAYGVKYRIEFTAKSLVNWRIDLLKNDYAGPIIERNHGADEPNFEFDIEKSIGGVKFDFSIEATTADNTGLTDLFVEDPREFQVIVYRETTAVWFGFLVPEQYSDNYVYPPYDISLSAVDGLGMLKNEDFTLTGVKSEIEILTYILEKTGLSLPIGVCVHIFPQGVATNRAPLQNVFQDCSAFATSSDVPKCYDVLEILLQSYGEKTYITQQNGRWFVFREIDLGSDIHIYTSGSYSSTESAPAPIALGRGLTLEPVGNLVRAVEKRFHRIEVTHDLGKKTNMFLPGIINASAGEFYAYFQRAKYWTPYATSQYPKIVRYGANAELLLLIAGADNNPGAISDPVYYITNSRPLVFKLDYGIAFTRNVGYTGVQPIYVKIKIGSYFLTKTGWSLTSYTWELPKLAKDNFTNWGVLADPPPASGNLVVEVYNNYLTPGCYIRSFEFNYAEETAFPAKNTYSFNNAVSVINTSKYDIIGDIVPDENAHLIYTRYKMLSDRTPTQNWKFPSTANFYSLALCNCRLEASNNRKARQKFTGSLSGVLPGYFFRINHTDAGITTPLYPQKATLNIFTGELTGEFLEWLPFVEQAITVAINEDYEATGSGGSGASGGGGGSSVVSTPVLWDNVNSKPPFIENINSYFGVGDNSGVAYIRALKDLHVEGNLYQQGTAYETHVEHLFSKNDFIILREDAVSALPSNQLSGFKILKANGTVNLIFGAGNDAIARVGWEGGSLQAIATRVDTPVDNGIAVWENANNRFSTPHLVSDFPRKAENAVISGAWSFATRIRLNNQNQWFGDGTMFSVGSTNNVGIRNDLGGIYFGNDTPAMSILLNKRIGVGTTSPEVLFHVAGNARVNSQLQVGMWNTYIYGGGHAGLYASGEQYFRAEGTNNLFRIYKNTIAEGDLHVEGNLYQQGSAYETHVEHLFSKNDFIILREDAVSGLPSNQLSGFKILKANGTVNLIFGAGNDAIGRIGWEGGSLQAIATRADTPTNNGIAVWNNAISRFDTPYLVSDFPRKAENATIAATWTFTASQRIAADNSYFSLDDSTTTLRVGLVKKAGSLPVYAVGNASAHIWAQANAATIANVSTTAYTELMRLNSTGLGIGINAPTEKLEVAGNLKLNILSAVNGTFSDISFNGSDTNLGGNPTARIRFTRTASGALGNISFQVRRSDNFTTAERMLISNDEVLFHTRINSPTFISGFAGSGWRLSATDNHLTVDKLTVRGQMSVYELVVNQIRATNGSLWVSDAIKTTTAFRESDWDNRYIHFNFDNDNGNRACPFIVNDIVQAQRFNGRSIVKIVGVVYQSFGTYFRVDTNNYMTAYDGSLTELDGLEFVRIGHTSNTDRQGAIYLTSSDNGAPYIDIVDGVNGTTQLTNKTRLRIGKLSGISGQSGYGIWGSRDGVNEAFAISSNGYARIAGWSFTNNQLVSPTVGGGFIQMSVDGYPRIQVYRNEDNRVNIYHYSSTDWGIAGRKDGAWVFRLGGINQIAGCSFDSGSIWSGTAGSEKWKLNADGSGQLASGKISWTSAGAMTIQSSLITSVINTTYIQGLSLNFTQGTIGGFAIGSNRIGVVGLEDNYGLAIYNDFIKFSNANCFTAIGVNVLPAPSGSIATARFKNSTYVPGGTNYGIISEVTGAYRNIAFKGTGDIVTSGFVHSYCHQTITPASGVVQIPSLVANTYVAYFQYNNSGVSIPTKSEIQAALNINTSTAFSIRITIIIGSSAYSGTIWGRNTTISGMNTNNYAYIVNNAGTAVTTGISASKGDVFQFQLVYDTFNFYAYTVNTQV